MNTFRHLLVAASLITIATLPTVAAHAQTSRRAGVEHALLAIDSPAPASYWQNLGGEGLRSLEAILNDAQAPLGLRRRAVYAARHYGEAARSLLTARLQDAREDQIVRRYAALAMAEGLGMASLDTLAPLLGHADAGLREGVVIALAQLRNSRARHLIESRRRVEQDPVVRLAIDQALTH